MEKKTYIINLYGEDSATTSVELAPEVYETLKEAFEDLNNSCRYASVTIEEHAATFRIYYVRINRNGKPIDGPRTTVSGCDIPKHQDIYKSLHYEPREIRLFQTWEEASAFIDSFKKKKEII